MCGGIINIRGLGLLIFIIFSNVALAARAELYQVDSSAPNCHIKKYQGNKWNEVNASEVENKKFTTTKKNGTLNFKISGVWYNTTGNCVKKADSKVASEHGSTDNSNKSLFAGLNIGSGLSVGGASPSTSSSSTYTYGSYSNGIAFGGKAGYKFMPDQAVGIAVLSQSGSRTISPSGSQKDSFLKFLAIYEHIFTPENTLKPKVGANVGLGTLSSDTVRGNEALRVSGTGIAYGIEAGALYALSPSLSLEGMLGFQAFSVSKVSVKQAINSSFAVGQEIQASSTYNQISIAIGVRLEI